ncbi:hypothetical protein ARMSODRAFT_880359, partial [Armillaria solidipes]
SLLLLRWKSLLNSEGMPEKVLLCDVSTCWNSTFDMLHAIIHYQVAVKKFTADVDNDLHALELTQEEWKAARELCDVLKVTINLMSSSIFSSHHNNNSCRSSRM